MKDKTIKLTFGNEPERTVGKNSKVFELTFNEDFKSNTEAYDKFTMKELEKILEALSSNKSNEREMTILNWNETHQQAFHEAMVNYMNSDEFKNILLEPTAKKKRK